MSNKVQILGLSKYYPAVLFDVLKDIGYDDFEIYPNLETDIIPFLPIQNYHYKIQKEKTPLDLQDVIVLGVSGPKNKIPVFNFFSEQFSVKLKNLENIIHPNSCISGSSALANGIFIEQNVIIGAQTKVGNGVSLKRGANIGHHCEIGDWVDINPGVVISGKVKIGHATIIGSGAVVIDGIEIGDNTLIGAGSVVTKDIPAGVIAFGNPCKVIKENEKWTF